MVITTVNRVEYNGDGINKAWPYTFRIIDDTDIKLLLEEPSGRRTEITSDYYVDTVNKTVYYPGYAPGAEPPLADQPPVVEEGQKIIVYRSLPITQEKNLGEKWPFSVIELALDKLTMLIQDVWGWLGNNIMMLEDDSSTWDAKNRPINNVGEPAQVNDAATKQYVDNIIVGIVAAGNDVLTVDNVAVLRSTNLQVGMYVNTAGYYDINDGGGSMYFVRANDSDTDDGGSIIILDNNNVAELLMDTDVVDPLQFGAVCDGTTDDAVPLQNCVNYAKTAHKTVKISKHILVDDTITVPSQVNIYSEIYNEFYPRIFAGPNCTTVFDCVGVQNAFRDIRINNYTSVYRDYVGFDLHGNARYDVDSYLYNCAVAYAGKGTIVRGRNVKILYGLYSHCQYGVYYDIPSDASGLRGCEINGTRFHGIGEEEDLKFVNCAAIHVEPRTSGTSNFTVTNCTCDQGCTFFEGDIGLGSLLMDGNFIESFVGPLISVSCSSLSTNNIIISNNLFKGITGQTTFGETYGRPDYLCYFKNCSGLAFNNNYLTQCNFEGVILEGMAKSVFSENTFSRIGMSGVLRRTAFALTGCSDIKMSDNYNAEYNLADTIICIGDNSSTAIIVNNARFVAPQNFGVSLKNERSTFSIYEGTFGTQTSLTQDNLADGAYLLRIGDTKSLFMMFKRGSYMGFAPAFKDSTHIYYVDYALGGTGKITLTCKSFNPSNGTLTDITPTFYLYAIL